MAKSIRISRIGKDCVACGSCVPICPKGAIQMKWGITAYVDRENVSAVANAQRYVPRQSSIWWKGVLHNEE